VSVRARKGSTSESLAQETSAITTTESAETRIIDFFMAETVVDAAGQFNRRAPCSVKRAGIVDRIGLDRRSSGNHRRGWRDPERGGEAAVFACPDFYGQFSTVSAVFRAKVCKQSQR